MQRVTKVFVSLVCFSSLVNIAACGLSPIESASQAGSKDSAFEPREPDQPKEPPEPAVEHPIGSDRYFRSVTSCDDFRTSLFAPVQAAMQKELDRNLADFVNRRQMSDEDCEMEEDSDSDGEADDGPEPDRKSVGDAGGEKDAGADEADDASSTNNQEGGVDEADMMKNDRSHIYVLADGAFQVLDAWPAEQTHRVSKTKIEGIPRKMFVHGKRAFVYSSGIKIGAQDPVFQQASRNEECTYGYDCDFVGDGRSLIMTELDLSDLNSPKIVRRATIKGSLLGARRIGDRVYTVVLHPNLQSQVTGLAAVPSELKRYKYACGSEIPYSVQEIRAMFTERSQKNQKRIDSVDLREFVPSVDDWVLNPASGKLEQVQDPEEDCGSFMVSQTHDGTNVLTLLGTDMKKSSPFVRKSMLGRPGAVYASGAHLYLASRHYVKQMERGWFFPEDPGLRDATSLHRFDLFHRRNEIRYVGSGTVKGRILNQFSLSHHKEHLRVATTTGRLPDRRTHNTLSIVTPVGGELVKTGEVDDIAPAEDIRSVRFVGDKGYIVTFRTSDPLFVLDLANPKSPSIEGELKIPGFSTYMHPMGPNHLLTVGYNTEGTERRFSITGVRLQIMDVSNPNLPRLIHKELIGTSGSSSAATSNHLAFNYYARRKLLALPMIVCEEIEDSFVKGPQMTFNGLLLYDVTASEGFRARGGLPLELGKHARDEDACFHWWTDGFSPVRRSVFMEDYVYAISDEGLHVARASEPGKVLRRVAF